MSGFRTLALVVTSILATACVDRSLQEAGEAWQHDRAESAFTSLQRHLEARNELLPNLWHNLAISALAIGRADDAERAANRGGLVGAPQAWCEFILGNASDLRARVAAATARGPAGRPSAFDAALGHLELAIEHWRTALAAGRSARQPAIDRAAARRNLERAVRLRGQLTDERDALLAKQRNRKRPPQPGEETPPPNTPPNQQSAGADLLQQLARSAEEKKRLRQARRDTGSSAVERDW